ncbi:RNase A-like domain-containing protein [Streptomyces roseoverticillatus]|uniref:RNase A-like domain-containing protein n=1 Tax=Streptomyces roseoverticillatus TaxID=66429 RepID=UPI0033D4A56F
MAGGSDHLPSEAERKKEREALKTPLPSSAGGFDVKPQHLYYTSLLVRDDQFTYDGGAKHLVDKLGGKAQLAGRGSGPDAFAASYEKVAKRFLEVWAKSVVSVGGVAVGLTVTANNYAASDWFSNKKMYGPPPSRQLPAVINKEPHYGTVPDLKWRGTNADSSSAIVRGIGHIPDFLADSVEEVIDKALRLGKMYEVTPGAHAFDDELKEIASHWKEAGRAALKAGDAFAGHIGTITDTRNNDWQSAMRMFCQSIWGTTPWGGTRYGQGHDWRTNPGLDPKDRRPILTVLSDTAEAVAKACTDLVDAATKLTDVSEAAAIKAGKAMVKDMVKDFFTPSWDDLLKLTPPTLAVDLTAKAVMSFRKHMDYDGVNAAVDTYNETVHGISKTLEALIPALDEAHLSAPSFRAEEARAEGFGARSLTEFKNTHTWTQPGDTDRGVYRIDLADTEWMENSHTLSKHVGLDDDQLAQRLRDDLKKPPREGTDWPYGQPRISDASTFRDFNSAQQLTQYNINENSEEIRKWMDDPDRRKKKLTIRVEETPDNQPSGRSINKFEIQKDPFPSGKAKDVTAVETDLVYNDDKNVDPPFTVLTSMPVEAKKKGP